MIERLRALSWPEAVGAFTLENLLVLAGVLAAGRLLRSRSEADQPPALTRTEILLAGLVVGVNISVTLAGWELWRRGVIRVRAEAGWTVALDVMILLVAMDGAMYLTHRLAHHPRFYERLHAIHHRYDRPRPLTLFVMHPLEAAAFGALWLGLISVYSPTWTGLSVYLVFNVVSGTVGHLGVAAWPGFGLLAGSDFHGLHHRDPSRNLGFYTRIWDRLFRTEGKDARGASS